jgi:hypothetical protein
LRNHVSLMKDFSPGGQTSAPRDVHIVRKSGLETGRMLDHNFDL